MAVFVLAAILGPLLAPYSPDVPDLNATLQGPSAEHLLGTDQFGRDLLSRLLYASRVAAEAVLIVIVVGGIVGTILGSLAGLLGGAVDAVISRIIEIVQGFPIVLLAIAVVAVAGPSLTQRHARRRGRRDPRLRPGRAQRRDPAADARVRRGRAQRRARASRGSWRPRSCRTWWARSW